jgi:hypothetical protein
LQLRTKAEKSGRSYVDRFRHVTDPDRLSARYNESYAPISMSRMGFDKYINLKSSPSHQLSGVNTTSIAIENTFIRCLKYSR